VVNIQQIFFQLMTAVIICVGGLIKLGTHWYEVRLLMINGVIVTEGKTEKFLELWEANTVETLLFVISGKQPFNMIYICIGTTQ
jgi:hypothetical protein